MKTRFDCFIIWGNGLHCADSIIEIIRDTPELSILKIVRHRPPDIGAFVRRVYERDYAPFHHLTGKTQYLMQSRPEVLVVFVRTSNPRERPVGVGAFMHVESEVIREVKEQIRNAHNPRDNGMRTEEHVVHASDHEAHTDHILRVLGVEQGIAYLSNQPSSIIDAPCHLAPFERFRIKWIPWQQLYCVLLDGESQRPSHKTCRIEESPHYRCLCGEQGAYVDYLTRFASERLCDDHGVDRFLELAANFRYLEPPHHTAYVVVKEHYRGEFVIQDGLHRACIARHQGADGILVAVTP